MGKAKPRRIRAALSDSYGHFERYFRQVATDGGTLYIADSRCWAEGKLSGDPTSGPVIGLVIGLVIRYGGTEKINRGC